VAQLDELTQRMKHDTRRMAPRELAWQPARGMNSIGMLLGHIAIVEVYWIQVGPLGRRRFDFRGVLGLDSDDDGMPLPPGGKPPRALHGRSLAFFDRLIARARAHTKRAARRLTDADLDRDGARTRRDGTREVFNVRWVLYHMLEHLAGHYGQILMLRHHYRASRAGS
jgi:uncharacterized damage-inducible protein DinB